MIRVAFTEAHGLAAEYSLSPPEGVQYSFLGPSTAHPLLRSPIKGYLGAYGHQDVDLIEAVLSPIRTAQPWIFTCADAMTAAAFTLLGVPLPRSVRMRYLQRLLLADNCKKVVFRSEAGRRTLETYGGIRDPRLLGKTTVVYPAVRSVPDALVRHRPSVTSLLFSGDFFRKGGANVVDAFERVQRIRAGLTLTLCCSESDFRTPNAGLRREYRDRIERNPGIVVRGRLARGEFVDQVLPDADIYLMPSYVESFGFAILEAMARGVPVISTNYFAIPEMIDHGVTGLLVDTSEFDCDRLFRGYVVSDIPPDFHRRVTESLTDLLLQLVDDSAMRHAMGLAARNAVRERYSFEARNSRMLRIYNEAI